MTSRRLQDAESLIRRFAYARIRARLAEQMRAGAEAKSEGQHGPGENGDAKGAKEGAEIAPKERAVDVPSSLPPMGAVAYDPSQPGAGGGIKGRAATPQSAEDVVVDLDSWFIDGVPWELSCAVSACRAGVKRAHLVDIRDQ